jgi:type IV pilus assembly protein PilW
MRIRGFTLIEVLVGVTVSLLAIAVITSTFLSQQRAMQALDLSREASNSMRDAMLSMQETLGRAGYGIDPRYVYDFRNYNCPAYAPASPCRDSITGPDEIVFVTRNPNYYWAGTPNSIVQGCDSSAPCTGNAWAVLGFDSTHVTISAKVGDQFLVGQVIEFTCVNGANPVMGTVKTRAPASGTVAAAAPLTIELTSASVTNPYQHNLAGTYDACFNGSGVAPLANATTGTSMFLVDRYRYHVATANGEPWLMLDRGLDYNNNGVTPEKLASGTPDVADEIPIARGVEGMQLAYVLRSSASYPAPDNGGDWVVGDTPAVREEPDPTATAPLQTSADTDPNRFNLNPANILGVRIRITVRSLRQDVAQPGTWLGDPATPDGAAAIENRNDFTAVALGRYRRYFGSVTVTSRNMTSKNPFIF